MNGAENNIWREGLWENNPGLVQLLGLCPLLAVTSTLTHAIGLGIATLLILVAANVLISLLRGLISPEVRLPAFVLIIAGLVTLTELAVQAWLFELYLGLGIFLPLIVTNCMILGRAEAFASRRPVGQALIDGLAQGLGFAAVLIILGTVRELLGRGTLLAGADTVLGFPPALANFDIGGGLLIIALAPGAFLCLGGLVAGYNALRLRNRQASPAADKEQTTG